MLIPLTQQVGAFILVLPNQNRALRGQLTYRAYQVGIWHTTMPLLKNFAPPRLCVRSSFFPAFIMRPDLSFLLIPLPHNPDSIIIVVDLTNGGRLARAVDDSAMSADHKKAFMATVLTGYATGKTVIMSGPADDWTDIQLK